MMKTVQIDLPSHWACYLVNGDEDSLSGHDLFDCDQALAELNLDPADCLSCDNEFIGRFNGLFTDLSTYVFSA